jgi:hypothetical protein
MVKGSPESLGLLLRYASYCFFAFALLVVGSDLAHLLTNYTRYPFGDHWIWLLRLYEKGTFFTLTTQYNEHRLVVPGIFYLLDHRLFGTTNSLLIVVSILLQAGCGLFLITPIWRQSGMPGPVRLVFAGFVGILMFWFIQGENFFYPFSLCMACSNLGILAALHFMGRITENRDQDAAHSTWLWAAVLISALWATFSYGHGLLIWPILVLLAWVTGMPARRVALVLVVFAVVCGLYFLQYHTPENRVSPVEALRHPLRIVHYLVLMMGLPMFGTYVTDLRVSMNVASYVISAGGILIGLLLCGRFVWLRGGQRCQASVFYHAVMGLCLGAALITAVNRSEFPTSQALSGRYAAIPLLFWVSLAGLATRYLTQLEIGGGGGRTVWCGVLIAATLATLPEQFIKGGYFAMRSGAQKAAALSIAMGAPDRETIAVELTNPERIEQVDKQWMLSSGRPSIFARPETAMLGKPLLSQFRLAPSSACRGTLDAVTPYQSGSNTASKLIGWAWATNPRRQVADIYITDAQMVVRGLGSTHVFRPDVANHFSDEAMNFAGFQGYAPLPMPNAGALTAFADLGDGQGVCQIGEPRKPGTP